MQSNLSFQTPFTRSVFFISVKICGEKYNLKDWEMNMEIMKISVLSYVILQPLLFYLLQKYQQLLIKLPENTVRIVEYFENNYVHERTRQMENRSVRHISLLFLPEIWSISDLV